MGLQRDTLKANHPIPKGVAFVGPKFVGDHNTMAGYWNRLTGQGGVSVDISGGVPVVRGSRSGGGGALWFQVTGVGTTTATIGTGYGQYAGTVSRISDGTETVASLSTDGTYVIRAKLELATGVWSFDSVAVASNVWDGGATDTDGSTRTWALAMVTVASSVISSIKSMTNEAVLYESRA